MLKVAFLVESWGEPWNEGYKNLAKYIADMLSNLVDISVFSANKVSIQLLENSDLIYIFNYVVPLHLFAYFASIKRPIIKHVAKKELDISVRSRVKALLNIMFIWNSFIVTTNLLREEVKLLAKNKPIFYLPPPIPTDYFRKFDRDKSREKLGLESDKIYVGYTGRLNKFRNLEMVFRALNMINDKRVEFILSIFDIAPEEFIRLKRLIATNRVRLKFVNVKDVRIFYSSADILVYPVERRGAIEPPLTVLEAMSCGTIVAAYKNQVTSRIIQNSLDGFLFSNHEELATIIKRLLYEVFSTKSISEAARNKVIKYFDSKILLKKYLDVLNFLSREVQ